MLVSKKISRIGTLALMLMLLATSGFSQTAKFQSENWVIIEKTDGITVLVQKVDEVTREVKDTLTATTNGYTGNTYAVFVKDGNASLSKDGQTVDILSTISETAVVAQPDQPAVNQSGFQNPFGEIGNVLKGKKDGNGAAFLDRISFRGGFGVGISLEKANVSRTKTILDLGLILRDKDGENGWTVYKHQNPFMNGIFLGRYFFNSALCVSLGFDSQNATGVFGAEGFIPISKTLAFSQGLYYGKGEPVASPTSTNPFGMVQPLQVTGESFIMFSPKKFGSRLYGGLGVVTNYTGATDMKPYAMEYVPTARVSFKISSVNDAAKFIRQF